MTDIYIKKLEMLKEYALENPGQGDGEINCIFKYYKAIRRGINAKNKRIAELEDKIQELSVTLNVKPSEETV
jgi:hypothetical protein